MGAKNKVLMLLVPAAAVLLLFTLARQTVKPVAADDFRDLRIERRKIPDEKNFRIVLERAGASMPGNGRVESWFDLSLRSSLGLADHGTVCTALVQTAEARDIVQSGVATCEGYAGRGERAEFVPGLGLGSECGALPYVWRVSFEDALSRGEASAAYDRLREGLQIVGLLLKTPSDFCDEGMLVTWFGQAVSACEKMVHHPGCRDEWLAELDVRIPRQEAVAQAGEQILKGQFWQCLNAVASGAAAKAVYPATGGASSGAVGWHQRVYAEPTRQLLAEAFRNHVAALAPGRASAAYFNPDFSGLTVAAVLNVVKPNAGGRGIVHYYSLFARINVGRVKALENGAACLLALIACERYRRENGGNPETLDALVPKYLDAVPIDTFSGRAMRYSRERGILWSVGQNGADDGGATCTDKGDRGHYRDAQPRRALDMVFPVSADRYNEAAGQARMRLEKKKR